MAASYTFSSLPNINIPRTAMKVECTHPTSFKHGKIIPLFCIPVGPAENYKLYLNSLIRMQNPIFPFYGDIKVFVHSFFVPMRLVWEHTAEFFGENVLSKGPQPIDYLIPAAEYGRLLPNATYADKVTTNGSYEITGASATASAGFDAPWIESVSHYLMKPIPIDVYLNNGNGDPTYASKKIPVSILKERAFWSIYNEYYRPQQLVDPIYVNKSDNPIIGLDPNRKSGGVACQLTFATEVPTCCKMFDYFRSATTSPIYSDGPVEIPITLNADLMPLVNDSLNIYDVNEVDSDYVGSVVNFGPGHSGLSNTVTGLVSGIDNVGDPVLGYGGVTITSSGVTNIVSGPYSEDDDLPTFRTSLYADPRNSITGIAGDVDKLRYLFAQYNFLYRDNFGTRYPEIIQTHFNLKPSIAILQRPELLHEGSFPINVSQVLSTAGAADDSSTTLGQPGANSVTANRQLVVNKSIEEWGFIFVTLETKHKRVYTSSINAQDLRRTKFEHYFPEFALVGNKKIVGTELSVDIPVAADCKFDDAFAYQEAWAPERYFISKATGLLDVRAPNNYGYMTLAEDLDSPEDHEIITADFVMEDRRAIARCLVSGENGPDYTADFALTGVMAKPMPLYSEPGLIDHIGAW